MRKLLKFLVAIVAGTIILLAALAGLCIVMDIMGYMPK